MPIPNRYKPQGTTAEVEFPTTRPCYPTMHSHINQVVADTLQWEQSAAFHLEALALRGLIKCYAKNDHLGLTIQYEYFGVPHNYEPDFVVRLKNGVTLLLGKRPEILSITHNSSRIWLVIDGSYSASGQVLTLG
jgi:type III restriction enzyme